MTGFFKRVAPDEICKHVHVLTPGRYAGAEAQEDDGGPFEEKMKRLTTMLQEQMAEEGRFQKGDLEEHEGVGL